MSNHYEFYVTLGASEDVDDRETAASLLQWMLNQSKNHSHVKYVTVQHSELDEAESKRLLEMLDRFDAEDLERALASLEPIRRDDSDD